MHAIPASKRIILMPHTGHGSDNTFRQENDRFLAGNLGFCSPQ